MNIIEKLGITPGLWEAELLNDESDSTRINGAEFCSDNSWVEGEFSEKLQLQIHRNAQLIAAAPEMLEALIGYCINYEVNKDINNALSRAWYEIFKSVIEKATGKTWEEIKELL